MDNDFFMSAGLQQQHWQQSLSSTAMQIHPSDTSCFNPNWDTNALSDHHHHHHSQGGGHFESARSSMVSSPAAPNSSYISNESVLIRELIGKLGNMGNPPDASSSPGGPCNPAICYNGSNSTNTSCYSTPLSSPPKVNFPVMDHLVKERFSSVAEFTADPGFAERAARFSCFGSRSFNGRTAQLSLNNNCSNDNGDPRFESNPAMTMTANSKFQRVSSSPSLEALAGSQGSLQPNGNSRLPDRNESMVSNSNEESSVSEQIPGGGENGSKASNEANSRKRKAAPKGRAKDSVPPSPSAATAVQVDESNDNPSPKRSKQSNGDGKENESVKAEDNGVKTDAKPPEPPKDYIHVRARRGQATDSHSLAERVRREKISERMKLLQDLVPGCNKVTGKALMLDEIINYVQSLQRQVEFLSMKLASVNTILDFNSDGLISKDVFQSSNSIAHHLLALDSSVATFHGQRPLNPPAMAPLVQGHVSNGTPTGIDPLNLGPGHNLEPHLHQLNELQNFCGDDLQSIVQMGFGQNSSQETAFHVQSFRG